MAFGDVLGTFQASTGDITNPFDATGTATVAVGDLVYCMLVEDGDLTVTAVGDNLGNTYTATNAGNDAGAITARAFYSRVTTGGSLTTLSATATASTHNAVFIGVAFAGPFTDPAIDANPANGTADVTSPFTCPATGTLAQAAELIVAWGAADGNTDWAATSPNVERVELAFGGSNKGIIGSWVVAATDSVSPAFTAASGPSVAVLGTTSFKSATSANMSLIGSSLVNRSKIMGGRIGH